MTGTKRPTQAPGSAVPPSRLFCAPRSVFDTEIAVLTAGASVRNDAVFPEVKWIASEELPDAPLWITVAANDHDVTALAEHLVGGLRATQVPAPAERTILVGDLALADRIAPELEARGLRRRDHSFFGISAERLAEGASLPLDPLVGDEAWRDGTVVERALVAERWGNHAPPNDAMVQRLVDFKRRQQRQSPPIRRFVARAPEGTPIAMIGYAPFAACDLGFAPRGVLVRLRDVAVVPSARRHGIATALLRSVAARAIEECGATQVVIGAAVDGPADALYRKKIGAREIGGFASFVGEV